MPKLFVLVSHELTPFQREDAAASLGVSEIVLLGGKEWSQIPAEDEDITVFLAPLKQQLQMFGQAGDFLLVQGDFGATYNMVEYANRIGMKPVYATTKRLARDMVNGDEVTTLRTFEHVRFRRYR